MKINVLLTALCLLLGFVSCQSDDDATEPSGPLTQVALQLNQTAVVTSAYDSGRYRFENLISNCNTNANQKLTLQQLHRINDMGYRIELDLMYPAKDEQFMNTDPSTATLDYQWEPGDCAEAFELVVRYYNRNYNLYLPRYGAAPYHHVVDSIEWVGEDDTHHLYRVNGHFEVSFKQTDNSTDQLNGSYTTYITTLK